MYNKYRSFQKIITIIILFFPAQKIYIDISITPQIKTLYTLHPFQTFQNSTHSHTKKKLKTHKNSHFSILSPTFIIIPYNIIQPPQIHLNKPINNLIISTLYPYTVHPLHPIPYPINPNNNNYIFFSFPLFLLSRSTPGSLLYPLYAAFISLLYHCTTLYTYTTPIIYPYTHLKAFKALYSQYNPITLYNIH